MSNNHLAQDYVRIILRGFHKHFEVFQQVTASARPQFAEGNWHATQDANRARISFYDQRVAETTQILLDLTQGRLDEAIWLQVRKLYHTNLQFHPQAELAETFYNSVFCQLFHRRYFNNAYIFVESTLAQTIPLAVESEFRSYFPLTNDMDDSLRQVIDDVALGAEFADLEGDIKLLREAFRERIASQHLDDQTLRIDVLKSPFYRNKAAYVVGRVESENHILPFIVPILRNEAGMLYLDALLTDAQQMAIIFGFARTYFMVEMRAPSALVGFLSQLMPNKTKAELYSAVGLHKQSKTEFYRDFLEHLHHGKQDDGQLISAAGVKGMVMTVFTLPSFPYVFKVIKDEFGGNKSMSRQTVIDRYRMVKQHDRAGRMADTYEFADVAIPLARISANLLAEFKQTIASSMTMTGDMLVIKQLFVERRMVPLNLFLESATDEEASQAMKDYGQALKDMLAANIFPGDMLLKNFGLTRHRRVVFYDYDEVRYLTEMNFRAIPQAETFEQQMASEPWYQVGPDDVFPEQLPTFAVPKLKHRQLLLQHHPQLAQPEFWQAQQQAVIAGTLPDVFPYPQRMRFQR